MTNLHPGSTLTLRISGGTLSCQVEEATTDPSPHTGRQVAVLRLSVTVPASAGDSVAEAIGSARLAAGALPDADGSLWQVTNHSSSYSSGGGPRHFSVVVKQVEEVHASEVKIGQLVLTPSSYTESIDDHSGALIVTMRCPLDADQLAAWRAVLDARSKVNDTYYPVERAGVETGQRSMRPGRSLWMRTATGVEAEVVLVEEAYDKVDQGPFVGFSEPQLTHALRWSAGNAAQFEALLAELSDSGLLASEAVERIRRAGDDALKARQWDLAEVDDLDAFSSS